jgi:menaquinone-9 beta-reductase
MVADSSFDVVIAGGGLAGSSIGGVLARSGLGVLVVEKEPSFRDRIRGEVTWPWGHAEALRAGLGPVLERAGGIALPTLEAYEDGSRIDSVRWADVSIDGLVALSYSHPRLQQTSLDWASGQGATVWREAKVIDVGLAASPVVTVEQSGGSRECAARLVICADGKKSPARRWVGAKTIVDPEHHRFGGVALSGVKANPRSVGWTPTPGVAVSWFARDEVSSRVYVRASASRVRDSGISRSVDSFVTFAGNYMPEGTLADVEQVGPLGFFANSCTWPTRIAAGRIVLIGDAAGAVDPSQGLGTSLLFRDVRELSELLMADLDWDSAAKEFANRRQAYYGVLRAYDRWCAIIDAEEGPAADRRRELHAAAREADPTLGGFATLEARGPDGLNPDEAARRAYFGDIAW